MTAYNQSTHIRHLFRQGLQVHEICARAHTSKIFTQNALARLWEIDPQSISRHFISRRVKGRMVRAALVNNDPYFEEHDRFNGAPR